MGLMKRIANFAALSESNYPGLESRMAALVNFAIDSYLFKLRDLDRPTEKCPDIREMWLNTELHKMVSISKSYAAHGKNATAYGFAKLLYPLGGETAPYQVIPFLDSYPAKEDIKHRFMMHQESIRISPTESMTLPVHGIFFILERSTKRRLLLEFDLCFETMGCSFNVSTAPADMGLAECFLRDLDASRTANNIHYKQMCAVKNGVVDFCDVDPTSWDDVVIKPQMREMISRNTSGILKNIDSFNAIGMSPSRNVLLISPPGMAKTMIFRATAGELIGQCTILWCTGKSIESASNVTSIFNAARDMSPCVVMIEDMDLFGGDRSLGGPTSNWILNEFLACLDGAQSNPGVVVMASTNDVASMDEALVNRPGRFDVKLEMPLPDKHDRMNMIKCFCDGHHAKFDNSVSVDLLNTVLDATEGMTGAYIKDLVKCAIISAVNDGRCDQNSKRVILCGNDLTNAVEQVLANYKIGSRAKKHHPVQ